jgi:glycosidase
MDPYLVDPRLGTREDLQALTHTAHNLGMHVLFDMVVHGFDPQSALVRERPEMFFHNEDGSLAAHPTWKTISTDWASPSYREYMTDLVRHQVEVYEIDGYRLDAAAFKGANWDPNLPYPAERSGCAALELLGEMRRAGRERKSDFIILNEVFGPAFYAACDLTHDNMTMGPEMFLEAFQQGQAGGFERADIDAELYKEHMANLYDLLPQDARRVFFARNHDTSWFYHFGGYTPRHRALDAVHAFFGIPEFFGGDPNNGPNPEDVPDLLNDMQTIWAARKRRPEWTRGKIMLHEVSSDNRLVFAGVRRLGENAVLALVSFSSQVEQVRVTWEGGVFTGQMEDVLTGHTQQAHLAGSTISVEMQPFQILIG